MTTTQPPHDANPPVGNSPSALPTAAPTTPVAAAVPVAGTVPQPPDPAPGPASDTAPEAALAEGEAEREPWLVVVDPQRIFADPASDWGSPMWAEALANIRQLLARFEGRTVITRWVPPFGEERTGSWLEYMRAWPFADRAPDDPHFDVVEELRDLPVLEVSAPTFGKWEVLEPIVGRTPSLVLTGVSTDCCVVSTALPAADAGATITLVSDACAGSTPENHAAALQVMGLYPPQITLATTEQVLAS